ncbi:hypothetical protein [Heliorestis convoluta]|uniref:Uncharacterized protein n=1 Tax=Heliorestis convoluta TaxID=356322 RepID=A0A5Q2N2M7_9FIRM|nr:hypothetical protein [Heliorestis convoluta]QGG48531.1 hypothetical protein FTV88_2433 [Heliorestis convoluta]
MVKRKKSIDTGKETETVKEAFQRDQAVQVENSDAIPAHHAEIIAKTNMGVLPTPLYSELEDPESFRKRKE